jgi:hypothetical protein
MEDISNYFVADGYRTPLQAAAELYNPGLILLLVENGVDVNNTPTRR